MAHFIAMYFIAYLAVTGLEGKLLPWRLGRMRSVIPIILHRVSLFNHVCVWFYRGLLECCFSFHYTEAEIKRTKTITLLLRNIPNQTNKQKTKKTFPHASRVFLAEVWALV